MSTRYFITCMDCKDKISVVDRSFRGKSITPEAKRKLPEFVMAHVGHKIKLSTEYDEMKLENEIEEEQHDT